MRMYILNKWEINDFSKITNWQIVEFQYKPLYFFCGNHLIGVYVNFLNSYFMHIKYIYIGDLASSGCCEIVYCGHGWATSKIHPK